MDEDTNIVSVYSLEQAIKDGVLVEVFKPKWQQLTQGKPIVATAHLFNQASQSDFTDLWNKYVEWRHNVKELLPEEDQLFVTELDGKNVWVIEDGQAITMMYPEEY